MAEVAAHHHHATPGQDTSSPHSLQPPQFHPLPQSQPQLQSQPQQQQSAPHGKKRPADNSLESEQRLSKRFDLLNLVDKNGTRLYIPVPGSSDTAAVNPLLQQQQQTPASSNPPLSATPIPLPTTTKPRKKKRDPSTPHKRTPQDQTGGEFMQIDPTPHKVYIHDLSAELSASSDDDNGDDDENSPPIFLSDIEKHLSKIPRHVLLAGEKGADGRGAPEPRADNQMVLYNVPSSLSVPQEMDSVRKAIVEARARVRERQACGLVEPERVMAGGGADAGVGASPSPSAGGAGFGNTPLRSDMADSDVDAMDID